MNNCNICPLLSLFTFKFYIRVFHRALLGAQSPASAMYYCTMCTSISKKQAKLQIDNKQTNKYDICPLLSAECMRILLPDTCHTSFSAKFSMGFFSRPRNALCNVQDLVQQLLFQLKTHSRSVQVFNRM